MTGRLQITWSRTEHGEGRQRSTFSTSLFPRTSLSVYNSRDSAGQSSRMTCSLCMADHASNTTRPTERNHHVSFLDRNMIGNEGACCIGRSPEGDACDAFGFQCAHPDLLVMTDTALQDSVLKSCPCPSHLRHGGFSILWWQMPLAWWRCTDSQILTAARGIRRQCLVIFLAVTDESVAMRWPATLTA